MSPLRSARGSLRALGIVRVLLRHRLDSLLEDTAVGGWLWLLKPITRDELRHALWGYPLMTLKVVAGEEIVVLEARRHSPNPDRANDVSVVLDLMIHDIGIVLALVKSLTMSSWGTYRTRRLRARN